VPEGRLADAGADQLSPKQGEVVRQGFTISMLVPLVNDADELERVILTGLVPVTRCTVPLSVPL